MNLTVRDESAPVVYIDTGGNPNTEAAEQTFVWLGRFKRLLNSMSKRKHHFFLHSLVRERNEYTEWCFSLNITPKLPQARGDKLMVAPVD